MESTISVRLKKPILKGLIEVEKQWQTDRSEAIRRLLAQAINDWKIKNALENLKLHRISISKAAVECNISLWEMTELVREKSIDWAGYSREDLDKDIKLLR